MNTVRVPSFYLHTEFEGLKYKYRIRKHECAVGEASTTHHLESLPMPVTDTFLAPVSEHHANLILCIIVTINLSIKLDIIWVFPGPLDLEKLKHALARTLRDYPHAAGRLSYDPATKKWRIRLTKEGVPISTGRTEHPGIFSNEFNHERSPDFLDTVRFPENPCDMAEEPLVRFKLTSWEKTGETSLSMSVNHVLGQRSNLLDNLRLISQ